MVNRSLRADVRNPVLRLETFRALAAMDQPARSTLRRLLYDLAADASWRAELAWRKHKAPMAAYWKAVAVYARHIARGLR